MRTSVIGGGSWGTALAGVLAENGHAVKLWTIEPDVARAITETHENPRYLRGIALSPAITGTTDLSDALADTELVLLVTPSHVLRSVLSQALALLPPHVPLCCAAKGIENDTLMTMSEVMEEVLPPERRPYFSFLSGPSFAAEVARHLPTAVVVAAAWDRIARQVQAAMTSPAFRVYTSPDVIGVELGGALKNVIAIAAGASDGLGYGLNARAGLITRGLSEITRLAVSRGANPMTLSGLAGLGDLVLTCTGELSRNRQVGFRLGEGVPLAEVLAGMDQVAEGVKTAKSAHDLAHRHGVEVHLIDAVFQALYEGVTARDAVAAVLGRSPKAEFE